MALSMQKSYPYPPAIVIERPHNSPGESNCESCEDLEADCLGALNDGMDVKYTSNAPLIFFRQSKYLSPMASFVDSVSCRSDSSTSQNNLQDQTNPNVLESTGLCRISSLRASRQSVVSTTAHSNGNNHSSSFKVNSADSGLLNIPRPHRPLSHSYSLRSSKSYKEHPHGFSDQEVMSKTHEYNYGRGLLAFDRSEIACCACHKGIDPSNGHCHNPYLIQHNNHSQHSYPFVQNDALSGSNLSQLSALEAMHEARAQMFAHPNVSGSSSDKLRVGKRNSLTATYSSSGASSPQLSRNCLLNLSPQSPHSNLSNSYPTATLKPAASHLRRASSMIESAAGCPPRRRSDTDFTEQKHLLSQNITSHELHTHGCRGCRRFSISHGPCRLCTVQNNPALTYHVKRPERYMNQNSSFAIRPSATQRFPTDATETRRYWLQPPLFEGRVQSASSQPLVEPLNLLDHSWSVPSPCQSECIGFVYPETRQGFRRSTVDFPVRLSLTPELGNSSVMESDTYNETKRPWSSKEVVDTIPVQLMSTKSNSNGLCFCQLIVLLVCMQIVVGLASTGLGLYLRWRVPLLPIEECAFWAAIPIMVTGLTGTYFCFQHRLRQSRLHVTLLFRRIARTLSLISCILCLVASIFSGQKGSLIATYGTDCVPFSLGLSAKNATESEFGFQRQCCIDGFDQSRETVCQCFNVRNQLLWSYRRISCRYLFSSVKDYLILQSALMAVGTGVCLWFWVALTEQFQSPSGLRILTSPGKMHSTSSTKYSTVETTITSVEGKRCPSEAASDSVNQSQNRPSIITCGTKSQEMSTPQEQQSTASNRSITEAHCNKAASCETDAKICDKIQNKSVHRTLNSCDPEISIITAKLKSGLQIGKKVKSTEDGSESVTYKLDESSADVKH